MNPPGGWAVAAALFVVTYAIANPFAAFGVFLPVLADAFGWSRGAISLAMSINLVVGSFLGLWIGTVADRRGPRLPLLVTVLFAGAGFTLAASVTALWQLYLYIGVMAGIGMSGFYVLGTVTVSRWFTTTSRGLALGIVLTGFNLGFMTGPPAAALLIEHVGWRVAFVVLGGSLLVVGALASLAVTFPAGTPIAVTASRWEGLRSVLGDWRVWVLGVSWLLTGGVMLMLNVHVVPFARDRGIRLEAAALAITAYGLGAVIGRVGGGLAADRIGTMTIMWTCYALQLLSLVPLLVRPSQTTVLVVFVLFGIGFAAADTAFARAMPEVFGLARIGAIFGLLTLLWRWGAALGPATAGFAYDATGSYAVAFALAPVAIAISFVLFVLPTRHRRV